MSDREKNMGPLGLNMIGSLTELLTQPQRESMPLDGAPPFQIPEGSTVAAWRTRPVGGQQARIAFPNGYEASVVRGFGSYGVDEGLWELAVCLENDGRIVYDTPITDDVIGHLTEAAVTDVLYRISALPPREEDKGNAAGGRSCGRSIGW